eukprot:gb/GFBE01026976.1/.p1 GENE.gb/GFBE01026976.1/~~gb/GFBE01026976.1/.p1  ORF type:complete len:993 (+),score=212.74 gb/GFBE01026976.1/:1-2979(+)
MMSSPDWAAGSAHTAPLPTACRSASGGPPSPRSKRHRVSFATVSTRTFDGFEDLRNSTKDEERQLSPLADASMSSDMGQPAVYNDEGTSEELGELQRQAMRLQQPSSAATQAAQQQASFQRAAAEQDCSDDGSDISGEVTANVESLSRLVLEDELDLRNARPAAAAPKGKPAAATTLDPTPVKPGRGTPVRTPTTETEMSPLPEAWDLYQQFKGSQGALGPRQTSAEKPKASVAQKAPGPGAAASSTTRSPPPSMRRGRSPDTVDMGAVMKSIQLGPEARSGAANAEESEVPEGRKSFVSCFGASQDGAPVSEIPTPSRAKRQGGALGAAQKSSRVASSSPLPATAASSLKSPGREARFVDFEKANREFTMRAERQQQLQAAQQAVQQAAQQAARLQSPPPAGTDGRRGGGFFSRGSQERVRSARTSSVGEADSLVFSPTTESALPGVSALHPIPQSGLGLDTSVSTCSAGVDQRVAWDDFLNHCGINFVGSEPVASALDAEMPPAGPAPTEGCSSSQRAADALLTKRSQSLLTAVKELANRNETAQKQYGEAVQRWNEAPMQPACAGELLKVLDTEKDLEILRSRIKSWQAHCKNEAWLKWYAAKHEWLRRDLDTAREHTAAIRTELNAFKEAGRKIQEVSKKATAMVRHQHHRGDLNGTAARLREARDEAMHDAEEDRQLMLSKVPETREAMEEEQRSTLELEQRVEEARLAAQQSQMELHQAKRDFLRQKAKKVDLQQMRYARTCLVNKATAMWVELSLRGGAGAVVSRSPVGSEGRVQIRFSLPSRSSEPFAALAQDLFTVAWQEILMAVLPEEEARQVLRSRAPLEVAIPCGDVPRVLRRLDCGALHVEDQLRTLRNIKTQCTDVNDVSACVCQGEDGHAALAVSVSLTISRSHAVSPGPGGLVQLYSAAASPSSGMVDAAKCIIKFNAALANFPDYVDWAEAAVHQVLGRGREAEEVQHALGGMPRASVPEAVVAAAQAMRQAPTA